MNKESFLLKNKHWKQVSNTLVGEFRFSSFIEVDSAVRNIMHLAESLNHHPEVTFGFNTLRITLVTHDAENSITEKDIEFAEKFTQTVV